MGEPVPVEPDVKIAESTLNFSSCFDRQIQKRAEQRTTGSAGNDLTPARLTSDTRVSLNSNQWQSVATYSNMGNNIQQQMYNRQSQFNRFYSHNTTTAGLNDFTSGIQRPSAANQYFLYQDTQQLSVNLTGTLVKQGGEQIQFQFSATAFRSFSLEYGRGEYAERVAARTDPLIINYGGGFNNLSTDSFKFDLNGDGKQETLSRTGAGSGFLALDRNGDGQINNGSELFGSRSGNGFAELAQFDEDGNGFIDEGDSVFSQLLIYEKTAQGEDQLTRLADTGIAAIGLDYASTPFRISDDLNHELGIARATGIFIREDGSVGSVQQIDLSARDLQLEQRLQQAFAAPSDAPPTEQGSAPPAELENLMQQLEQVRRDRLARQEELSAAEDSDAPKSLLEQLVDQLEEYTKQQTRP